MYWDGVMRRAIARLRMDQEGGVLVESTVMLTILFIFTLGSVDFLMAMYQWGAATKAVQAGARIASVSTPVDSTFLSITGMEGGVAVGSSPPATFTTRTCAGTGPSSGTCSTGAYSATAMDTIVYGRKRLGTCAAGGFYCAGMNDMFARIGPQHVQISYVYSGLGFAGRPGGQVPTIRVTLQNLNFQFYFLGGLMGFSNIPIAPIATVTGEDISSAAPTT